MPQIRATSRPGKKSIAVRRERLLHDLEREASWLMGSSGGGGAGYPSARSSRLKRDRRARVGSADWVLERDREDLVRFSRALDMGSLVYRSMIGNIVTAIVGRGIRPRAKRDMRAGVDSNAEQAVKLFTSWADDKAQCDLKGMSTFWGLQSLAVREFLIAGEGTAVMARQRGGSLQMIEAERITTYGPGQGRKQPEQATGNRQQAIGTITDGVEIDEYGRPAYFHISPWDPTGLLPSHDSARIPAPFVCFMPNRERPSATRGVPRISAGLERCASLDETHEAIGLASIIAAMFAAVVTSQNPGQTASVIKKAQTQSGSGPEDGADDEPIRDLASIGPGLLMFLQPGEDIKQVQGNQPAANFDAWNQWIMVLLAASFGYPLEVALRFVSRANFSVARMAQLLAKETSDVIRGQIVSDWCWPVFEWKARHFVARGLLERVPLRDEVQWPAPPLVVLEPDREVMAWERATAGNFASKDDILEAQGLDPEAVRASRAYEVSEEKKLGIVPPAPPGSAPAKMEEKGTGDRGPGTSSEGSTDA